MQDSSSVDSALEDSSIELRGMTVTEFERSWWDKGSGAWKDCSIWRPRLPRGWVCLGHTARRGYLPPNFALAVEDDGGRLLRSPVDFELVWKDSGSGDTGGIWRPVAPQGYVAMGCCAWPGTDKPPLHILRCVRRDTVERSRVGDLIWKVLGVGLNVTLAVLTHTHLPLSRIPGHAPRRRVRCGRWTMA